MSKTTKPQAAEAAPADATQTAATEITQAADAVAASTVAMQEELAEALKANEKLAGQVEALTELSNSLSDEKNALLLQLGESSEALRTIQAEAAGHKATIEGLQREHYAALSDDALAERWIAAGGTHATVEAAKQFAAALLA